MANEFDFGTFEKYGPSVNGATFSDWATVGVTGNIATASASVPMASQGLLQDWVTIGAPANGAIIAIIEGLAGVGKAVLMQAGTSGDRVAFIRKSFPSNFSRIKFGFSVMTNLTSEVGVRFLDAGTVQCSLIIDVSGRVTLYRGNFGSTTAIIFQSGALVLTNQRRWIECDITFHNTTGAYEIRMDGTVLGTGSGVDLCSNANNFANQFDLGAGSQNSGRGAFGGWYYRENSGGTNPFLGDKEFDTCIPTGDNSVQFTPTASAAGPYYAQQNNNTNAPGANQLVLIPVTPEANMTINSIGLMPRATSATAKFKGVIYADNGGTPNGALLSDGTEAVGCTSGTALSLALVTPQALTAGTQYWIGYYTDTSVAIQISNGWQAVGQRKANTYTSGAPNPGGTGFTTGQNPWAIWGNCTAAAANWQNAANIPSALISNVSIAHNQSATVGHKDYYNMSDLAVEPDSIYAVKASALWQRTDAGARTGNIKIKSGSTESNGNNSGITPPTTMAYSGTIHFVDPATSAAWTAAGINGLLAGVEVAS